MKYIWVNLLIVAGPLLLSFDQKVSYYRRWPAVLLTILAVGVFYLAWDAYATRRGQWGFNSRYISGTRVFGLPLEEILFFSTVPFSCIFILECVRAYLPETRVFYHPLGYVALALVFGVLAYCLRNLEYTRIVLIVTGLFFLVLTWMGEAIVSGSHFWIAIMLTYIPFIVFNGVLTRLPIVIYTPGTIIGIRITSIPLEDFVYSFSMLGFYFLVFLKLRDWLSL